jgi:hypothetical protein
LAIYSNTIEVNNEKITISLSTPGDNLANRWEDPGQFLALSGALRLSFLGEARNPRLLDSNSGRSRLSFPNKSPNLTSGQDEIKPD